MTILIMLLWYLDNDLRQHMPKSVWIIPLILDACLVIGLYESISPTCRSIGGILSGCEC